MLTALKAEPSPGGVPVTARDTDRGRGAPQGQAPPGQLRQGDERGCQCGALSRAVGEAFLASVRTEANPNATKSSHPSSCMNREGERLSQRNNDSILSMYNFKVQQ